VWVKLTNIKNNLINLNMRNIIPEVRQTNFKEIFKGFKEKIKDLRVNTILRNKNVKKNTKDLQIKFVKQIFSFKNRSLWIKCNYSNHSNRLSNSNSKYSKFKDKQTSLLHRQEKKDIPVLLVFRAKTSIRLLQLTTNKKKTICKTDIKRRHQRALQNL